MGKHKGMLKDFFILCPFGGRDSLFDADYITDANIVLRILIIRNNFVVGIISINPCKFPITDFAARSALQTWLCTDALQSSFYRCQCRFGDALHTTG